MDEISCIILEKDNKNKLYDTLALIHIINIKYIISKYFLLLLNLFWF